MILPTINHYNGNQTRIKAETGVWSVVYNAENRPIRWESGDTVITMAFDRMGRRVEMRTVKGGEETLQRFVYDNYLCVQQLRGTDNTIFQSYVWDPTEPIATRPLRFTMSTFGLDAYYFHDGNKNVTDLVATDGTLRAHYNYTPFGVLISAVDSTSFPFTSANPFRFSSEVSDSSLGLVYYNYRHYNPILGRWVRRDPIAFVQGALYSTFGNSPENEYDFIGLATIRITTQDGSSEQLINGTVDDFLRILRELPPCSITNIEFVGHGSPGGMEIFDDSGIVVVPPMDGNSNATISFTETGESFAQALKEKMACDAVVELNGCNTAWEGETFFAKKKSWFCDGFQINIPEGYVNLAHTLSIEMPEQTIKGHSDYRRGFPGSGFGLPDFLWRSPDVSYKGGVRQ